MTTAGKRILGTLALCLLLGPAAADDAAFFYTYDLRHGERANFEQGYRSHLGWHADNDDPLSWYGWYVITGTHLSRFVDATIGISLADFDARVKPAEDAQHFEAQVAPYADQVARSIFRVRSDLGGPPVDAPDRQSRYVRAVTYTIRNDARAEFETAVRDRFAAAGGLQQRNKVMVLERRDGGNAADYLFLHFMGSIAELDLLLPPPSSAAILAAHSELWLYRDALSYFPR